MSSNISPYICPTPAMYCKMVCERLDLMQEQMRMYGICGANYEVLLSYLDAVEETAKVHRITYTVYVTQLYHNLNHLCRLAVLHQQTLNPGYTGSYIWMPGQQLARRKDFVQYCVPHMLNVHEFTVPDDMIVITPNEDMLG